MKTTQPFLSASAVKMLLKETPPRCFHCGVEFIKDLKHCGENHNTWMPNCTCINKPIRIVTTGDSVLDIGEKI